MAVDERISLLGGAPDFNPEILAFGRPLAPRGSWGQDRTADLWVMNPPL